MPHGMASLTAAVNGFMLHDPVLMMWMVLSGESLPTTTVATPAYGEKCDKDARNTQSASHQCKQQQLHNGSVDSLFALSSSNSP